MPNPADVYQELLDAAGDSEKMYNVGEKIIEAAFESNSVDIEYKTMDTNLAVGEHTTDPTKFFADSVSVRNVGAGAGARIAVKGSYYSRVNTMDMVTPGPNLDTRPGENVAVVTELTVTVSKTGIEGEGFVLFKPRDP